MITFGIAGILLISLGLWLRETRQNIFFIIGGVSLLIYSFHIKDTIFMVLQSIFILSATIELIKKR